MYDLTHVSGERLEYLAGWADLERNQHWHTMLGWMLWMAGAHEKAKVHGLEAVRQDPHAWVAMEVVARACGGLKEYSLAIEWMRNSIQTIPAKIHSISGYMWPSVYDWSIALGDERSAFEAARTGAELNYSSLQAQWRYIKAMYTRGDLRGIIRTIEMLDLTKYPGKDFSQVANLFVGGFDVYTEIGHACRDTNQPVWVLERMQTAIKHLQQHAQNRHLIQTAHEAALFSYDWYDEEEDRTIEWAELFLFHLEQESASFQLHRVGKRKFWIKRLAQLYFDKATQLFQSTRGITAEVYAYTNRLKNLAVSLEPSLDGFDVYLPYYPALLWGRWLREYQKADENVWRKCFRAKLLAEMNALEKDDSNSVSGLRSLAVAMLHAGDHHMALVLFAVLFEPFQDSMISKIQAEPHRLDPGDVTVSQTNESDGSVGGSTLIAHVSLEDAIFVCHNCKCTATEVAELYVCEICEDAQWCGTCLTIVRDHTIQPGLRQHKCSPGHDAYQIWPVSDEARRLADAYFGVNFEMKKDWLDNLRAKWF